MLHHRVCIWFVAGLCARNFRRKFRRTKHATTFDLALNRNYFYSLLPSLAFKHWVNKKITVIMKYTTVIFEITLNR